MGQQPLHRYSRSVRMRVFQLEPRQELTHLVVQAELASVPELHRADARKKLGDRADAVHGARRRWPLTVQIRIPEPCTPQEFLIVHDGDREPGDLLVGTLCVDPAVQQVDRLDHPCVVFEALGVDCGREPKREHLDG